METIFQTLLRMSLTGSIVILIVLLARAALQKAPKKYSYLLWVVVLFRLLCPASFTVELPFQLPQRVTQLEQVLQSEKTERTVAAQKPQTLTHEQAASAVTQQTQSQMQTVEQSQPSAQEEQTQPVTAQKERLSLIQLCAMIWLAGVAGMLIYSALCLLRLRKQLRPAQHLRQNLYLADVQTPFVLGLLRPKIYLPAGLSEQETAYIISHEQYHIRRADHVVKLLAFAALTLHWFNPLVWLAFSLAGQDMEMSCDEAVLRQNGGTIRADYAQSLLNLSAGHRRFAATPLAFGEGAPQRRIRNVLRWKKPAAIGAAVAATLVAVLVLILALNPKPAQKQYGAVGSRFTVVECAYQSPYLSMWYTPEDAPEYMLTPDLQLLRGGSDAQQNAGSNAYESGTITGSWSAVGVALETSYTQQQWQSMLYGDEDEILLSAQNRQLLEQAESVWKIDAAQEGEIYLLVQSQQEDFFLCDGREADDGTIRLNVVWRMLRSGDAFDPRTLQEDVQKMKGNDKNLWLFSFYETGDFLLAGFQSGSHLGFATFERKADGYKLRGYQDFGGESLYSMTIAKEQGMQHSITVALSSRLDLALVTAQAQTQYYAEQYVADCPAMVVMEWSDILPDDVRPEVHFYNAANEELLRADEEDEALMQGLQDGEQTLEEASMQRFYALFWELDRDTMQDYLDEHPQALDNGWEGLYINEAGFDDDGTGIMTTMGEQVLAIDAVNQILLVRVAGEDYRGVLAVAKDPAQLSIEMSRDIGSSGQLPGEIAEAHDGVLSMTANGFIDVDSMGNQGNGNGGLIAGYAMSNGKSYGSHFGWGYQRIELHEDDRFYIKDATDPVSEDCTDATEFQPALIVNGQLLHDTFWTEKNPRACIGQSDTGEILMLVIEGRMPEEGSTGTDANTCAAI